MPWPNAHLAGPAQPVCCAGTAAELVSLQHWNDDTGRHRCKVEALLPGSTQPDMGRFTPVFQGFADIPSPFLTVDRAGDLVAAGTVQDAVHDMRQLHRKHSASFESALSCRQP